MNITMYVFFFWVEKKRKKVFRILSIVQYVRTYIVGKFNLINVFKGYLFEFDGGKEEKEKENEMK